MYWEFRGKIVTKAIFPNTSYTIDLDSWHVSQPLPHNLQILLKSARKVAEIRSLVDAKGILENKLEQGERILKASVDSTELSFISYWHDPRHESDHLFSVLIGLSPASLEKISDILDQVFSDRDTVQIIGDGGFSSSPNNPHSKQPTTDSFEIGEPLMLEELTITTHKSEKPQQ